MGIEPTLLAWEAKVLPLNYTRLFTGFYGMSTGSQAGLRRRREDLDPASFRRREQHARIEIELGAPYANRMQIILNGEPRELDDALTVGGLIERLKLGERRLAVEVNEEVIPRSEHREHPLHDGDLVEIVHAIGGG